jgi:hypothetical protein
VTDAGLFRRAAIRVCGTEAATRHTGGHANLRRAAIVRQTCRGATETERDSLRDDAPQTHCPCGFVVDRRLAAYSVASVFLACHARGRGFESRRFRLRSAGKRALFCSRNPKLPWLARTEGAHAHARGCPHRRAGAAWCRLHLSPEQKRAFRDRDGQIALDVLRHLVDRPTSRSPSTCSRLSPAAAAIRSGSRGHGGCSGGWGSPTSSRTPAATGRSTASPFMVSP